MLNRSLKVLLLSAILVTSTAHALPGREICYDFKPLALKPGEQIESVNADGEALISFRMYSASARFAIQRPTGGRRAFTPRLPRADLPNVSVNALNDKSTVAGLFNEPTQVSLYVQPRSGFHKAALPAGASAAGAPILSAQSVAAVQIDDPDSFRFLVLPPEGRNAFMVSADPSLGLDASASLKAVLNNGTFYASRELEHGSLDVLLDAHGKRVRDLSRQDSTLVAMAPNGTRLYLDHARNRLVFVDHHRGTARDTGIAAYVDHGAQRTVFTPQLIASSGIAAGTIQLWSEGSFEDQGLFIWSRAAGMQDLRTQMKHAGIQLATFGFIRILGVTSKGEITFMTAGDSIRYYRAMPTAKKRCG